MNKGRRIVMATALATAMCAPAFARDGSKELPPPKASDVVQGLAAYRIGPMDKLDVTVFEVKDLTGPVDVDSAGMISLPLVGTIQASGRTPTELSKAIADRLRGRYIKDPQVSVSIKEAVSQKITVEGAVVKPGAYPIAAHTTLSTAVALAEGADPQRANEHKVYLIRSVDGKRMQATYDLASIRKGSAEDPEVYGNDIIVVDNSRGRGLLRDLATAGPLFYLLGQVPW